MTSLPAAYLVGTVGRRRGRHDFPEILPGFSDGPRAKADPSQEFHAEALTVSQVKGDDRPIRQQPDVARFSSNFMNPKAIGEVATLEIGNPLDVTRRPLEKFKRRWTQMLCVRYHLSE